MLYGDIFSNMNAQYKNMFELMQNLTVWWQKILRI